MIREFSKPNQDADFKQWLRDCPNGFYLNKRGGKTMMLHKVGCWHLGDGDQMNSTTNPKTAADTATKLFIWAAKQGIKVEKCSVKECAAAFVDTVC